MWEVILKILSVYFSAMLKFIFGPLGGYAAGLNVVTTILCTVFGMMTIVLLFTYSGNWIRTKVLSKLTRKQTEFSHSHGRFSAIWKKYGLPGVALLTPLILTPIGGTLIAVSSGSPKEKIIFYMFISASVWAVIFSFSIYFFGDKILPDFVK